VSAKGIRTHNLCGESSALAVALMGVLGVLHVRGFGMFGG
jgi:hypothetical protein